MTQADIEILDKTLPLRRVQKLIGTLMTQSKHRQPCCYMRVRIDMVNLIKARKSYYKATKVRATTNDFFFYAISLAVKKYPRMAARLDEAGENVYIPNEVGVGFAVAASQGLVVPVIKNVTEKTLPQIAADSAALLKKARANKLTLDDFEGANISFSSLGMFGVDSFIAIPPPKVTGVISAGRLIDTAIPIDGQIVRRKTMKLTLAVDQRIVTEFYAAKFMNHITQQLQNPETLTA